MQLYILITEHNGDVSMKKIIVYPENNRSAIATWYVLCAVRSESLNVVQLQLTLTRVSMIQCFCRQEMKLKIFLFAGYCINY